MAKASASETASLLLPQLSALDLDRLYAALASEGRCLSTIRGVHAVMSKALADAERKGLVARNVARLATPPKSSATRPPEMIVWTPAELASFLGRVEGHRYGPLMRTASMTGLRRSEACGLRWADIDLDAATLTVRQSVQLVGVGASWWAPSRRHDPVAGSTLMPAPWPCCGPIAAARHPNGSSWAPVGATMTWCSRLPTDSR